MYQVKYKKQNIKSKLIWLPVTLSLLFTAARASAPPAKAKSLKEIYKTGKIEFVQDLKINFDSFPEDIPVKLISAFCVGKDYIYIADAFLCNIKVLTPTGHFKKVFGQKGKGPADMYYPFHMTFSRGNLVVSEAGNRRFSIFDAQGNFIKHARPMYTGRVVSIKTLPDGRIIVERELFAPVKNELIEYFGLELFSHDMEYIKRLYQKRVYLRNYFTKPRRDFPPKPFPPTVSWGVLPGNKIVTGYSDKYRLEIMDLTTGKSRAISHEYTPQKITEADKKFFFENITSSDAQGKIKQGADKFTRDNTKFPAFKPAFKKLITDCEGNILVFIYKKSDSGKHHLNAESFDAFDPGGNFINHVEIVSKGGISIHKLVSEKGAVFWAVSSENNMDPIVVRYRVK